ncbi:hypothetical protein G0U57_002234 [Chelydra serpentina]|uniref:Ig-like domain-containing protein n=1 Tax=Chelydra serpentina TaxID=8475 RepID=A0A8T1S0Z5_CHESE|nr:hypothetical protein G0U57_002234 [Chelydra serpentina]
MSARQGDSVLFQCSVFSKAPAIRVIFCKDGEEVLFQMGSEEKITYSYNHTVSSGSSGNYACVYEIKDSNNRVSKSKLSPAKHLSVTCESGVSVCQTMRKGGKRHFSPAGNSDILNFIFIWNQDKKSTFDIFHGTEIQQHFDSETSKILVQKFLFWRSSIF